MKTTSLVTIATVVQLAQTIEARKAIEKAEKSLKDKIKEVMGDNLLLEAGNYAVAIKERSRRDLDKDALSHDMGVEFINKYTKVTSYDVMEVNKIAREGAANE